MKGREGGRKGGREGGPKQKHTLACSAIHETTSGTTSEESPP